MLEGRISPERQPGKEAEEGRYLKVFPGILRREHPLVEAAGPLIPEREPFDSVHADQLSRTPRGLEKVRAHLTVKQLALTPGGRGTLLRHMLDPANDVCPAFQERGGSQAGPPRSYLRTGSFIARFGLPP